MAFSFFFFFCTIQYDGLERRYWIYDPWSRFWLHYGWAWLLETTARCVGLRTVWKGIGVSLVQRWFRVNRLIMNGDSLPIITWLLGYKNRIATIPSCTISHITKVCVGWYPAYHYFIYLFFFYSSLFRNVSCWHRTFLERTKLLDRRFALIAYL